MEETFVEKLAGRKVTLGVTGESPPFYRYFAEMLGTFILIFIGQASIAAAVIADAESYGFAVLGWGVGVALAIYVVGGISGAHINPAVSIACAASGRMPKRDLVPYIISQLIGAFLGAAAVFTLWYGPLNLADPNRTRASVSSIFTCFYPNPGFYEEFFPTALGGTGTKLAELGNVFPIWQGIAVELLMTFLLVLIVVALSEKKSSVFTGSFSPFLVGWYVFIACMITAPLTMTCMNPARDLGPRLFALVAGYGPDLTFPGYRGEFYLFILPQIVGGVLAVFFYDRLLKPFYRYIK